MTYVEGLRMICQALNPMSSPCPGTKAQVRNVSKVTLWVENLEFKSRIHFPLMKGKTLPSTHCPLAAIGAFGMW